MGKFYEDIFVFKILLAGDATVGKSCLIEKYVKNHFMTEPFTTIGVDFQSVLMEYKKYDIKLQIWILPVKKDIVP